MNQFPETCLEAITVGRAEDLTKLTEARIETMQALRRNAAMRPKEVEEELGKTSSAAVKVLLRMQDEGWVEKAEVIVGGEKPVDTAYYQLTVRGNQILDVVEAFLDKEGDTDN